MVKGPWFSRIEDFNKKNSVVFFPLIQMPCRVCKRAGKDTTHDLCRRHAFCSQADGAQYYSAPCFVCLDLWERARNREDPADAKEAYEDLYEWIIGFRRNSRNRKSGLDFFYDPDERFAFQSLHAAMAGTRRPAPRSQPTPARPSAPPVVHGHAVSIFN